MNEESIANQYSPIENDMVDSNDNFEMSTSLNEEGDQQPERSETEEPATSEQCPTPDDAVHPDELKPTDEPAESDVSSRQANEDKNENKTANPGDCLGLSDLQNDDISDDENFKDDELDFEEVDNNSRSGCNEESLAKPVIKPRAEDGEVNSEEELEDGEVKEEDSDDELDQLNDSGHYAAHSNSNKPSPANLNALCRFYSKGLCTWGNSCRFVHDKPMGNCCSSYLFAFPLPFPVRLPFGLCACVFSISKLALCPLPIPRAGTPASYSPNQLSAPMPQASALSKSNENLNQTKLNYPKYNPSNNPPSLGYSKSGNSAGSYYNQSSTDSQWDRNAKREYAKKDQPPPYGKSYRSDEIDYDYPPSAPRNRYQLMDDRIPPSHHTSNYSRQTSSTPYYTSKAHHPSASSSQQSSSYNYPPRSSRGSQHAEANSYESEYERKRRLAFESAPWNEGSNNGSPRNSPVDRHSRSSSGSKLYKHHHPASSSYTSPTATTFKKAENAEHYLDPWRRSKSPFSGGSGSRSVGGAGLAHGAHSQTAYHHSKSKSDSGSNFSNSESELIDSHKAKRLDPYYANKQRPSSSSYRESSNGEIAPSYAPYENPSRHAPADHLAPHQSASSANKPPCYNAKPAPHHPPPEPLLSDRTENAPAASSYHHSAASASSYPKSTTPTNEMDIPNYERPKNPRTRKDSWSDSDSCSTSSDSSYSASGSDSESNSDEPYSRYLMRSGHAPLPSSVRLNASRSVRRSNWSINRALPHALFLSLSCQNEQIRVHPGGRRRAAGQTTAHGIRQ